MLAATSRFTILLCALLLFAIINPLFEEIGFQRAQVVLNLSFTFILFSGIFAVSRTRKSFFIVLIMGMIALALMWLKPFLPDWNVELCVKILLAFYFLLIAIIILKSVLQNEKVTWEKISAALCVYLLIGIVWAFFYSIADALDAESFKLEQNTFSPFVYFSMITLTSVGYGDIVPITPLARSLAFVEAITGQIYLTVLVSRLVSLHIVHASDNTA